MLNLFQVPTIGWGGTYALTSLVAEESRRSDLISSGQRMTDDRTFRLSGYRQKTFYIGNLGNFRSADNRN